MNRLASRLAKEANKTRTENDAETYRSTLNPVLDFFYLAPARQGMDNLDLFQSAYNQDQNLAIKAAFYLRDVRGGKGQRKTFRDILDFLYVHDFPTFEALVGFVPEFGRWDDVISYHGSDAVRDLILVQLDKDWKSDHPSLLAKWMPSENTSSLATRNLARAWMERLEVTPRRYRRVLSKLRQRIDVVERKMSAKEWESIEYPHVPSRAMKLYRKAFERHDTRRFEAFINAALKGDAKINSGAVYPHEIVYLACQNGNDRTMDAMWSQLPNYFGDEERNVLIVVDTSGSMQTLVGKDTKVRAIDVSVGLGLYCAERNQGAFHDCFITFSNRPEVQKISGRTLYEKVANLSKAAWDMNTDLQATFRAVLRMAVEEEVPAEEMPSNIVIISDMEFDACAHGTNLDGMRVQYERAGYEMPVVTFWNVQGRNVQAPALANESGVYLVSGFSAETIGKVLNAEAVTPEGLMLEILNSPRYAFVDDIVPPLT